MTPSMYSWIALAAYATFVLAGIALSEWRRRWTRRVLRDLSIDGLFNAVARGHLSSEEAAEEIVRRHDERAGGGT